MENAGKMTKSGRITGRRNRVVPRVRRAMGSQMSRNATYASSTRTCCVVQLFALRTPSTPARERLQTQKSAGPLRWLPDLGSAKPRTKYKGLFGTTSFAQKRGLGRGREIGKPSSRRTPWVKSRRFLFPRVQNPFLDRLHIWFSIFGAVLRRKSGKQVFPAAPGVRESSECHPNAIRMSSECHPNVIRMP